MSHENEQGQDVGTPSAYETAGTWVMRTRIAWHRDKTFCVQVRDPFVLKFRDYLVSKTEATTSRLADAELVPDADAATRACFLACWQYDHILDGDSDARKLYAARSTTPQASPKPPHAGPSSGGCP